MKERAKEFTIVYFAYKEDRRVPDHFQIDNYYLVSVPHARASIVVKVGISSDMNSKQTLQSLTDGQ